jgi:hypothetical protein
MTDVTAAMHMYVAWKSGSTKQEPVNMTYKRIRHGHFSFKSTIAKQDKTEETEMPKEAHRLDQTDQDQTNQDKTENVARTPYSSQDQDKTEDAAVHKEAQRILRMMKEAMMPKKTQCSSQDQDKTEERRLDQTDQRQQEQDMEFTKQQQDQQRTTGENEVKRVVTLDKTGQSICDNEGHEILDKTFEVQWDKHNEVSIEARKGEFMLRHWECNTKTEEMELRKYEIELQKQELQLRQEREKHEIEMQERKNTLEMKQDEHKRRMNSTLW